MSDTLVIQSHRDPLPHTWLTRCLDSVAAWARDRQFDYRFLDDALLAALPGDLREHTAAQPVIASDIARLHALEAGLAEGYSAVVWCDADVLVVDPDRLELRPDPYALGREVWIQDDAGALRSYVKVHNAFMSFRTGNSFLAFYRDTAERIVRRHDRVRGMAPQLVGPKLLTALHNVVGCPVTETAAMLCPLLAHDLLAGGGPAQELFERRSRTVPAAWNLCASLCTDDAFHEQLIAHLLSS